MEKKEIAFNKFYKLFNLISIFLVSISILLLTFKGLNYGVYFKGGTLIELRAKDSQINITNLRESLLNMKLGDVSVKQFGNKNDFLIKFEKKNYNNPNFIQEIKEEIKSEKNQIVAFDSGYIRSKSAIIDANITTLIAAIILFFMGSGPIKGFSVTLGVGIFTTLFSVYFIARLLTSMYVVKNKNKENLI